MKEQWFSARVTEKELEQLNDLARRSGRSRSDIVRRMLILAETPQGYQLLGIPAQKPEVEVKNEQRID